MAMAVLELQGAPKHGVQMCRPGETGSSCQVEGSPKAKFHCHFEVRINVPITESEVPPKSQLVHVSWVAHLQECRKAAKGNSPSAVHCTVCSYATKVNQASTLGISTSVMSDQQHFSSNAAASQPPQYGVLQTALSISIHS